MIIAVSSTGNDLSCAVDERFGRARGFFICDTETGESRFVDNSQAGDSMQGAGIQAAKTVIDAGAAAVVTGNMGPKAHAALNAAGVEIYTAVSGSVNDAVEDFRSGRLDRAYAATVEGHW